jgi:hypothetical protein
LKDALLGASNSSREILIDPYSTISDLCNPKNVSEIITKEIIAIETDMNKNYKGYADILNEEKNIKMNVILFY